MKHVVEKKLAKLIQPGIDKDFRNIELYYLAYYYLEDVKETYKKSTFLERNLILNKYIIPNFKGGNNLEDNLSLNNVESFKRKIYESELSASRKNVIYTTFRQLLTFAEDREFITAEHAEKLKRIMKPIRKDKIRKPTIVFWTPEEFDKFIATFKGKRQLLWKLYFLTTYWGASRMGEVNALTWRDFNFQTNTISINKSIDRDREVSTPKNSSSNAPVDMPTFLMKEIAEYKKNHEPKSEDNYVFFNNKVAPRTTIRRVMDSHAKMAGVHHIKFHGLRHSMASRMINAGINPLIVSKHLRHSSTQQTLDTYSHIFPDITKGIMDKLT